MIFPLASPLFPLQVVYNGNFFHAKTYSKDLHTVLASLAVAVVVCLANLWFAWISTRVFDWVTKSF